MHQVDVRNKHCAHPECNKCPSFNYPGKTPGLYCGIHKLAGMVDVKHKRDRSNLGNSGAVTHATTFCSDTPSQACGLCQADLAAKHMLLALCSSLPYSSATMMMPLGWSHN
jgi:hypothetical protein